MREIADRATEEARKHTEHGERSFLQEIRGLAESAGLSAGRIGDAMAIGSQFLLVALIVALLGCGCNQADAPIRGVHAPAGPDP